MKMNETGLLSQIICTNRLKLDYSLNNKVWNHKNPRIKQAVCSLIVNLVLSIESVASDKENKGKFTQIGVNQPKKIAQQMKLSTKWSPTERQKIFASYVSDKGLIYKIYKNS